MSYQKEQNGGKSVENLSFPHISSLGRCLKNNPHHCFSALIPMFVWKCFCLFFFVCFFLQAHSFHPLVASLALRTSLVGSGKKMEGEGTRCHCPTAADWRMCRGVRLMLYKMNTTSLCWAAKRAQKDEWIKTFVKWMPSTSLTNVCTVVTGREKRVAICFSPSVIYATFIKSSRLK